MDAHPINSLYGPAYDFRESRQQPRSTMMIAAVPRSGSTYLAVELWRTGLLGSPMEYVNIGNRKSDMIPRFGFQSGREYWNRLVALRTSPNGVFSFKAFIGDYKQVLNYDRHLLPEIRSDFTIYITPRDKLAEAISYARAFQTGQWFARSGQVAPPRYSEKAIETALRWLDYSEQNWERLFSLKACNPLRIEYEDLADRPTEVVRSVGELMGIDLQPTKAINLPEMLLQRDAMTDEWRERYLEAVRSKTEE